jgi:hypothetical protein
MRSLLPVVLLAIATPVLAQSEQSAEPEKPKTKLEAFVAQDGAVIVQGFSKIGEVKGQYGTSVVIESKEFTNASTGKKEHGITFEVRERSRLERDHTSYVDYDEIPSLIKGLEYIAKVDKSATPFENFQADYRTRGDLQISTYSTDGGAKIAAGVTSGTIGKTRAFLTLADLDSLRAFVETARAGLEKSRGAAK